MPLEKSASQEAFVRNLKTELKTKPRDQALAIAYSIKKRSRADGGGISDGDVPQVNLVEPSPPTSPNYEQATKDLQLTPQERSLYQRHLSNLYGAGGVDNDGLNPNLPAGSRSTLYQSPQEYNGKFYNIPTVWDGKVEIEPYTKPDGTVMDVPNQTALANVAKTGWSKFPSYDSPDEADDRYEKMHGYMEKDTADYMASKGRRRGGAVSAMDVARRVKRAKGGKVHIGPIIGDTGGRADKRPMHVPDGAYVLTSDHCNSLGQGNTLAGFAKLAKMFPLSAKAHEDGSKAGPAKRASGGKVPIYAADGEWVIGPDDIKSRWGDLDAGHKVLDAWQTAQRKEHIKTLANLDPPAQD